MSEFIDNEEILTSKPVIEMIALASEYCHFTEDLFKYPAAERLPFLQKLLSALYLKGLLFPTIEVNDDAYHERFITEEEYELVHLKLSNAFEAINYFSAVNLQEEETEAVPVSVSECLADIYLDLKEFLLLFEKGSVGARENAVAACRVDFLDNWGYKITILLPYFHALMKIE